MAVAQIKSYGLSILNLMLIPQADMELIPPDKTKLIIFDFDGVFTDNKVICDENGVESVKCCRADSLGINLLKKYLRINGNSCNLLIVSTEKNKVVEARSNKLAIKHFRAVSNKLKFLQQYCSKENISLHEVIYLGNDLNDLTIMKEVGCSVAPLDAHKIVKKNASIVLPFNGGNGFVRAFVEKFIDLSSMSANEIEKLVG